VTEGYVIIADKSMDAVVAAAPLRRRGFVVETFLTGSFNTQRKKAAKMKNRKTITVAEAKEIAERPEWPIGTKSNG
jgi:NAD(P)H-hydrate repair Nnr-like enzyme with NAD(P)H-hydrate epimerase domain